MNVLKLISRTNACMLFIMPLHHAMSSFHIIMPCQDVMSPCHIIMQYQHVMSSCHITMPCHHATSSCHVSMRHHHDTLSCHFIRMHFLTTTCQLEGVPRGTSAKIFHVGAKLQNAISFASGVRLTCHLHRWNQIEELLNMVPFLLQYDDF